MNMRSLVVALLSAAVILGSPLPAVAAPQITPDQLKNGPVPGLCLHEPGQLHDGALVTEAEESSSGHGNVWYIASASGRISPEIKNGAAAIIRCYAGGVSWPDNIVLYGPGPSVAGTIDLGDVFDDQASEVRPMAKSVKLRKGITTVEVTGIAQGDESPNFGSASATIRIAWRSGSFKVIDRVIRNHVSEAKRFVSALKTGRSSAVAKVVGSRTKAKSALRWYRDLGKNRKLAACTSVGANEYRWLCEVGIGYVEVTYDSSLGRHRILDWYIEGC